MKKLTITFLVALVFGATSASRPLASPKAPSRAVAEVAGVISLHEPDSPFVAFNVWIKSGSAADPKGKEG